MPIHVAFLRAVNVGSRTVAMTIARDVLDELGLADVATYANTGNLIFSAEGPADALADLIRPAMEQRFGFELTTFVRTAEQVETFVQERPFGAVVTGDTYFGLFTLEPLSAAERKTVEAMSNDFDVVVAGERDVHWLMHGSSMQTTLGQKQWAAALPDNPTTARNMNLLNRVARRL